MHYPQPPMPRPGIGARLRNLSTPKKVLTGCGAVLALLLVCFCALVALGAIQSFGKGSASSTTPTAVLVQGVTPTPTATFTPTATLTPAGPRILAGVTLGGLIAAFQSKYGTADCCGGTAQRYHFFSGSNEGEVLVVPADDPSGDGKTHIASVVLFPEQGHWDMTTATQLASIFLPPDAKHQRAKLVTGYGTEQVYLSADLAATFPASAFTDLVTGKQVTRGTFSLECGQGFRTDGGCSIILGE